MDSNIKTHQFIDLNYLNLMADGDELMKKLMIETLLDEVPNELELIYQFYEDADWDELRRVSHRIKMLLAFVGNELLASTNREIEAVLRSKINFEQLPELFRILDKISPKVLEELRTEQASLEALV